MKIEVYFPHDACMKSQNGIADLIESEKVAGYGAYWAILEYLRMQEDYKGDIRAVRGIARQVGARLEKVTRVLYDYGLFVIEGDTFYSPYLNEGMKPLEEKRARKRMQQNSETEHPNDKSVQNDLCNGLEISDNSSKVKESKNKERITTSTSSYNDAIFDDAADADDAVADDAAEADWEYYVDELGRDANWVELMAKRGEFGKGFVKRFDEVLKLFKQHVIALGKEQNIRSLRDAKFYFNNYNTPGSIPYERMLEELQKPIDKGAYKYEDRHPSMGERSYCGVPIPPEAPPRPNSQAVWAKGRWVY